MGLDFEKPHFNLAVLPIENEVVNFKKEILMLARIMKIYI